MRTREEIREGAREQTLRKFALSPVSVAGNTFRNPSLVQVVTIVGGAGSLRAGENERCCWPYRTSSHVRVE